MRGPESLFGGSDTDVPAPVPACPRREENRPSIHDKDGLPGVAGHDGSRKKAGTWLVPAFCFGAALLKDPRRLRCDRSADKQLHPIPACTVIANADGGKVCVQNIGAVARRVHPAIDHLLWGGVPRRDILPCGTVPDPGVIQGGKAGGSIRPGVVKERRKFFDPHLGRFVDGAVGLQAESPQFDRLTLYAWSSGKPYRLAAAPLPLTYVPPLFSHARLSTCIFYAYE